MTDDEQSSMRLRALMTDVVKILRKFGLVVGGQWISAICGVPMMLKSHAIYKSIEAGGLCNHV